MSGYLGDYREKIEKLKEEAKKAEEEMFFLWHLRRRKVHLYQIIVLLGIISGALYLNHLAQNSDLIKITVSQFGYLGVFLIAVLAGFNLAVPLPAIAFLPLFVTSGFSLWPCVLIISIGMTLADTIGYFLGRAGHNLFSSLASRELREHLARWREHYHWAPAIVIFIFISFIPVSNEVLIVPLGFLGYGVRHLLLPIFLGNAVFNIVYAGLVLKIFGVGT